MSDKYLGMLLDGRYELQEVIGRGGMAIVYKAHCHRLNRSVAVKIMREEISEDEDFRYRFSAEAHAVAKLSHPNIVAVYDVGRNSELEYIVMELVDGITLKQYIDIKGSLSWKEAAHFARQISRALSHAHANGVIHCDIKPHNIMLLKDGTIKVTDFGIAALENEVSHHDGQAVGSIHYISPEQARGEKASASCDIYSLGVVLYEMLTGTIPYTGETLQEVAVKHFSTIPASVRQYEPGIPEYLDYITEKAMNVNPAERYASADELTADLDILLNRSTEAEPEDDDPLVQPIITDDMDNEEYRRRKRRAGRVSFALGIFMTLGSCVLMFFFLWNFWLKEVFSPVERTEMPNFVGSNFETMLSTIEPIYNFSVTYVIDPGKTTGTILSQSPEAGRSMMVTQKGIDVSVTVCAEAAVLQVPDVRGYDYKSAIAILQNSGFNVSVENRLSSNYDRNIVMTTSPEPGISINRGSTVYIVVSSGLETIYIEVPTFIGLTEEAAKAKLDGYSLIYGGCVRQPSDLAAGTVIGQSYDAGTLIEERSTITLTVSSGSAG